METPKRNGHFHMIPLQSLATRLLSPWTCFDVFISPFSSEIHILAFLLTTAVSIPPLEDMTGFHYFDPRESWFDDELIRFFHFLKATDQIGPHRAELSNGNGDSRPQSPKVDGYEDVPEICVIDADDLLDDPETVVRSFCDSVGHEFHPSMLKWDSEEHQEFAKETFAKWPGFHEDAIHSQDLRPRQKVPKAALSDLDTDSRLSVKPRRPKRNGTRNGVRSTVKKRLL